MRQKESKKKRDVAFITIRIERKKKAAIEASAVRDGRDISGLIRKLLSDHLQATSK